MKIEDPSFAIWLDEQYIIHVRAHGIWTPAIAERYWTAFRPFLDEARARMGHARALVDRRGAPIMPIEMVQTMHDGITNHYRPGDRLALVVDSSPLKSQVRQNYRRAFLDAFLSHDAALAWLENG
ncbi:hypothetical protein [Sphingomonas sp.]|uniref:hypothetical protein n=1 Tax=Sphingomonas sp. TaxID=28214 RepID=UPI0031E2BE20